jgi:hypothetical protein
VSQIELDDLNSTSEAASGRRMVEMLVHVSGESGVKVGEADGLNVGLTVGANVERLFQMSGTISPLVVLLVSLLPNLLVSQSNLNK